MIEVREKIRCAADIVTADGVVIATTGTILIPDTTGPGDTTIMTKLDPRTDANIWRKRKGP
jgi:hypothetical protein